MTRFLPFLFLLAVPALAQDKPPAPKPQATAQETRPTFRTLDKMLKDYRREAEAKQVATR